MEEHKVLLDKDLFNKIEMSMLDSFYNIDQFPYLKEIENKFLQIHAEWKSVTNTAVPDLFQTWSQAHLNSKKDSWQILAITEQSKTADTNTHKTTGTLINYAKLFPITLDILNTALGDRLDNARFSKLSTQSKILPHQGRFSNTLRCHLGIDIPLGNCKIKVGNVEQGWENGKLLILDDRLVHEAWNLTEYDRTVLAFDFIPDEIQNFFPY